MNISSVHFNSDVLKADNVTGFQVGPMIETTLPLVGVGIDAAVLYSQKGLETTSAGGVKNFDEDGLYRCSGQLEMEIRFTDRQGVFGSRSVYRFPCRR